jgi:hypothetical protein
VITKVFSSAQRNFAQYPRVFMWIDGLETLGIEMVCETTLLMLTELMLSYSDLDYGSAAGQIASHW